MTQPRRVFISYRHEDLAIAERLHELLERHSHSAFLAARSMRGGDAWMDRLVSEIDSCDAFVLLIGALGDSAWQKTEYQMAYARAMQDDRCRIVPLLVRGARTQLAFVGQIHAINDFDVERADKCEELLRGLGRDGDPQRAQRWKSITAYRGLDALDEVDADFFFGRDAKRAEVVTALAAGSRCVVVVGNSGVGKSSLVRAGVIPALRRAQFPGTPSRAGWPTALRGSQSWRFVRMTPQERPLLQLSGGFVVHWHADKTADYFRERQAFERRLRGADDELGVGAVGARSRADEGGGIDELIEACEAHIAASHDGPTAQRFVLVLDQMEELYHRSPPDEARRFFAQLARELRRRDSKLIVLATLRSDFYGHFQDERELFELSTRVDLPFIGAGLVDVLRRPVEQLDCRWDPPNAVEDIVARCDSPGCLPILSYLLEEMWTRMRERGDARMRWADYLDLGGIENVLRNRIDAYVSEHASEQDAIRTLFAMRLVSLTADGRHARRIAQRSECTEAEWAHAQRMAEPQWRLLHIGGSDDPATVEMGATVEVGHEVLLATSPTIHAWVRERAELLALRRTLEARIEHWTRARDDDAPLLRGTELGGAEETLKHTHIELGTVAARELLSANFHDFLVESRAFGERESVTRLRGLRVELAKLEAEADAKLWPLRSATIPQFDAWLARAAALLEQLPSLERALERLRARGFLRDQASAAHSARRERHRELRDERAKLVAGHAQDSALRQRQAELDRAIEQLAADDVAAPTPGFANPTDELAYETLVDLLSALAHFRESSHSPHVLLSVRERLELTRRNDAFAASDDARRAWDDAIRAIAEPGTCPAYGGLRISPQHALHPLGRNARGLYEFVDLQTGRAPAFVDGGARLAPDSGVVFVLLPGARTLVGTREGDASLPYADPHSQLDERGPREVELAPFFVSKYQLTQAQWQRVTGSNPSTFRPGEQRGEHVFTPLHPVEQVSWRACKDVLEKLGLALPTEAQWEYAARGGTTTPHPYGATASDLRGCANLADAYARRHGGPAHWPYVAEIDDGHVYHAPVGTYRANGFGLHDAIGNVWEWCLEPYAPHEVGSLRLGSGERVTTSGASRERVARGGSFRSGVQDCRSGCRRHGALDYVNDSIGVRPVRALDGAPAP